MNITSTRKADEFNRLLDSGAGTDDPVAAPLLSVAEALQAMPGADGPRPEFRQALRQRLVAVAAVQGVGAQHESAVERARTATSSWRVQRRLTALAAGAAVVTGVAGVGLGASRSLPGDPFYGVKRAAENAQLATTVGTEARGKRHLEFARTRLDEVAALAGHASSLAPLGDAHTVAAPAAGDKAGRIISTLHAMDVETRDGANDLLAAFRDSGSLEPLRALNRFTSEQYAQLHGLLPVLPAAAQPSARASLSLLAVVATSIVDNARSAGATVPAAPGAPPTGPASTTAPAPASSPSAPTVTGGGSAAPGTGQPTSGTSTAAPQKPSTQLPTHLPTQLPTSLPSLLPSELPSMLPTQLPTQLPSISTTQPVPLPSISTIPPLPSATTLVPTAIPTLPDVTTLLPGLGG